MALQTRPRADAPEVLANRPMLRRPAAREALAVVAILVLASALRVALAARAWPLIHSDEATLGLMADDILWHRAHPVFFYGQNYMGALQAYIAAPFFAVLGPTVLAIHIVTTVQFVLFALVLYAFTRSVYSPAVAWLTLALLALGPPGALYFELRAGAGTQDTLFFGALLLWLTFGRLQHPQRGHMRLAFDAGIGLAAGLGLWGDFLILPFMVASGTALAVEGLRRPRAPRARERIRPAAAELMTLALSFGIGAAPFIAANVASHGATFSQALSKTGVGATATHPAIQSVLASLPQQVVATLFVGVPRMLGSGIVCGQCAVWPAPHYQGTTGAALLVLGVAIPFFAAAIAVWAMAAIPLGRDLRLALRGGRPHSVGATGDVWAALDARWWGRAMLVIAAALTVLAYMASPVSFSIPAGSGRYLVGLYVCTPLVAAPLWQGLAWLRQHTTISAAWRSGQRWRYVGTAMLIVGFMLALVVLDVASASSAFAQARDRANYGIPAGARATQLMAFLSSHHGTGFYTTYWVCNDIIFESAERLSCAVTQNDDAFAQGLNRVESNWARIRALPHPMYVFDAQADIGLPAAARQVAALVARGDPRFAGYRATTVAGYDVYYYAG